MSTLTLLLSSSANIQQWASPFTAGVWWLSRPDQLTRLQTTSTRDGLQQTEWWKVGEGGNLMSRHSFSCLCACCCSIDDDSTVTVKYCI